MLQTSLLFQNHMVLQRDKEILIWGNADAGSQVVITMQGKMSDTTTDANGNWKVVCGPFKVSFAEEMIIVSGEEKLIFRDVQIGEVWLAGGQSNMEFHMRYDADLTAEKEICRNENIRFFDYPEVSYVGQIYEKDYGKNYGFWRKAEPEQLERFSAVGYYFAKDLQKKCQVPIGIIGCNWGGTPACAWMSQEAIIEGGGQVYLKEYDDALKNLDLAEYNEKFKGNPSMWRVDQLANILGDFMMFGYTPEEIDIKCMEMGIDPSQLDPSAFMTIMGPKSQQRPSGLYESMLGQIAPYTLRGVIWYQGETDGDCHPEVYETLFPALIRNWRQLWKEKLPFLFVQIAPLDHWLFSTGDPYIEIRKAQQHTADTIPGTGMAVITDVGMQFDIHPKKKQPVGHRLALLAENKVYGEDILCEAPTMTEVDVQEGRLILTFENAGEGLYLSDVAPNGQEIGKEQMGGLQVFQDNQELTREALKAEAEGNHVIIRSELIHAGIPTQVKLAETGWYMVNLYNSAGIPARPAEA